ncbi:hypothetical protein MASR2M78_29040 [Treponema sp.]
MINSRLSPWADGFSEKATNPFEQSVKTVLASHIPGPFLVAISGGADSTALLCAASSLSDEMGFQLFALHIDHGLRSVQEARADEELVTKLCRDLSVSLKVIRIERGSIMDKARRSASGVEAAARLYRHKALNEEADRIRASYILLGHTADDLLETTLMRFLKGSGPAGLASLSDERGRLLRPILSKTRSEVLAYLASRSISYTTDQSNADPKYFRNKVRLHLVPLLDAEFPEWRTTLPILSQIQKRAAAFIGNVAETKIVWEKDKNCPFSLSCDAAVFLGQAELVQEEALFQAINRLDAEKETGLSELVDLAFERIRSIRRRVLCDAIEAFKGSDAVFDLGEKRIRRYGNRIRVELVGEEHLESGFSLLIESPGSYETEEVLLRVQDRSPVAAESNLKTGNLGFNAHLPCLLRSARKEDRIQQGAILHKVKDLLKKSGANTEAQILIAEDMHGIAAAIVPCIQENLVILKRNTGFSPMDYAQSVFFSIFLKRGNHA